MNKKTNEIYCLILKIIAFAFNLIGCKEFHDYFMPWKKTHKHFSYGISCCTFLKNGDRIVRTHIAIRSCGRAIGVVWGLIFVQMRLHNGRWKVCHVYATACGRRTCLNSGKVDGTRLWTCIKIYEHSYPSFPLLIFCKQRNPSCLGYAPCTLFLFCRNLRQWLLQLSVFVELMDEFSKENHKIR